MRRGALAVLLAFAAAPVSADTRAFDAERAFAELLYGRYFTDPCATPLAAFDPALRS